MTFTSPIMLAGLLVLAPVLLLQMRAFLKGRREITLLGRHWHHDDAQSLFLVKWFFRALTFDIAITLTILALADPVWGERPVEEDRENLDVVVALDISRSMLAEDVEPSRLGRSLSLIRAVSRQLSATRFALVAFKGDGVTLLPLTEDLNALEAVLDGIAPQLVSTAGSDLEKGLSLAIEAFPPGTNAHRAIILISDGESLTGAPDRAAAVAASEGIPVITIVAGTLSGATLPAGDGTLIVDADGRPVISRAAPLAMENVSRISGSITVALDDLDAVATVVDELGTHLERLESSGYRLVPVRRYPLFVGAALVALVLSLAVQVIRWQSMF